MALDKSKIPERLAALQTKGGNKTYEKLDYTKIYWKPRLGEQTIRIVPSKFTPNWPFQQVSFHKDIVVNSMYALTNWGEKDPIVEFVNVLKVDLKAKKAAGENTDEDWETAKKLFPRTRTFLQVVERGQEHLGTRLYEFSNKVEEQILNIINNPEYGDITDVHEGIDLLVVGTEDYFGKIKYVKVSITPKRNSTPLATGDTLKNLLENQKDPLTLYKKYTYDEIHANLSKWLTPEDATSTGQNNDLPETVNEPTTDPDDLPFVPDTPNELVVTPTVEAKITKKRTVKQAPADKKPLVKEEVKPTTAKNEVVQIPPIIAVTPSVAAKSNKAKFNELFKTK